MFNLATFILAISLTNQNKPASAADFECNAVNICSGTYTCPAGKDCAIQCIGTSACENGIFYCPDNYNCNIEGSGDGERALWSSTIYGGNGGNLVFNCDQKYCFRSGRLYCPTNADCDVTAPSGHFSFGHSYVYAQNSKSLTMSSTANWGFGYADIYCPYSLESGSQNNCKIEVENAQNMLISTIIFAVESFTDVYIRCENGDGCDGGTMRCGPSYASSCNIQQISGTIDEYECTDSTSECQDYTFAPTKSPTEITTEPTHSPTPSPTDDPTRTPTTGKPTTYPTQRPTTRTPTYVTDDPTRSPTTREPTTKSPTTKSPTDATEDPTISPTTREPTTREPTTKKPTKSPTTKAPTPKPTKKPTKFPTQPPGSSNYHGTSTWNDLSIGDKVLIKFRKGGYLKDNGGMLSTNPIFNSESMIWIVKYVKPISGHFQFQNAATSLYLKNDGTNCISATITGSGEAASWNDFQKYSPESFTDHRIYHNFINKGKSECCEASSTSDTTIISSTTNIFMPIPCSNMDTYTTFEILDETQTISNGEYSGTSVWSDISEGDKVLIKFRTGGYLKDNGDNTVQTRPNFNSEAMIWEVRDDFISGHLQFKNVATGLYLKSQSGTTAKCVTGSITGSGDAGSWIESGTVGTETFGGHRIYLKVKNNKHSSCCQAGSDSDNEIVAGSCNSNTAYFTLEILDNVSAGSLSPGYLDRFKLNAISLSGSTILLIFAICIIINVFFCIYYSRKMCRSKNKGYEKVVSIETTDDEKVQFI